MPADPAAAPVLAASVRTPPDQCGGQCGGQCGDRLAPLTNRGAA